MIDEFGQMISDIFVPMVTLIGDTSGDGSLTGTDVSIVKLHSGTGIGAENEVAGSGLPGSDLQEAIEKLEKIFVPK